MKKLQNTPGWLFAAIGLTTLALCFSYTNSNISYQSTISIVTLPPSPWASYTPPLQKQVTRKPILRSVEEDLALSQRWHCDQQSAMDKLAGMISAEWLGKIQQNRSQDFQTILEQRANLSLSVTGNKRMETRELARAVAKSYQRLTNEAANEHLKITLSALEEEIAGQDPPVSEKYNYLSQKKMKEEKADELRKAKKLRNSLVESKKTIEQTLARGYTPVTIGSNIVTRRTRHFFPRNHERGK
ncbi:hypothetical protein [Roseibacillus ishigakijimensis]|uniref:Uncharacterized protein n=1 Tax=Roseibacillus ishigakijimensis TaxID=454146 RepID=A0A934RTD6_9BACT|nr:hypothetical protein [Roseibacillus ishigakijimensis]MBK1835602.1 hypothetical protein [Roseibacillus ishigakijimensis]